jgi:hypothetical protein
MAAVHWKTAGASIGCSRPVASRIVEPDASTATGRPGSSDPTEDAAGHASFGGG